MSKEVGRNDPCPCGSGKKYKKCCWQKGIKSRDWRKIGAQSDKIISGGIANVTNLLSTLKGQLDDASAMSHGKKEKKVEQEIETLQEELKHAGPDTHDEIKARIKEKMNEGLALSKERKEKLAEKETKKKIIRKKDTGKPF